MIETIYSNENGETNRTDKVQSAFKMPKNIRQVGKGNAAKKIYVEDYVMTFIKQLSGEDYALCKAAVLVGQFIKNDSGRNIFISGAIEVSGMDTGNEILFSNEIWTDIYEKIKKYFTDAEIVGWFYGGPGYLLDDMEKITKTHVDNFAGQDKTLLTYDNMEKEEAFYVYENSRLSKQEGYYIYYEKNEAMQNYMIEQKNMPSGEASYDDKVSGRIRETVLNKKPDMEDNKSVTRLMYAAGTLLAVIVLVVAAAMLTNFDQMKNMQNALNLLSENVENVKSNLAPDSQDNNMPATADIENQQNGNLDVNVVPGDVDPLDDEDNDNPSREDDGASALSVSEKPNPTTAPTPTTQKPKASSKDQKKDSNKEEVKYYTVKSGDSLLGISVKLYHSANYMKKIMDLNDIEDEDVIYIGQKLIVP